METVTEALTSVIEPIVTALGLELVEVQFRRESGGWTLRLIIDKVAGVSLDDCTAVSREIGNTLDVEDLIDHPYRLEVSSPGLDRPLKTERDFQRCKGQKIRVTLTVPLNEQNLLIGIVDNIAAGVLFLHTDQGLVEVPLAQITKARLEF